MIYVFKTSVKYKKELKIIAKEFKKLDDIHNWNFDLEDCDKILRIDATTKIAEKIIQILTILNFYCEELL